MPNSESDTSNYLGVSASPWSGPFAVYSSPEEEGFAYVQSVENGCSVGQLTKPLAGSAFSGRWDRSQKIEVHLSDGVLSSASELLTLNGANAVAIMSVSGSYEILQFRFAKLVGSKTWELSEILRGQVGTEVEAANGALVGAQVVLLNQALVPLSNADSNRGLELNWLVGPVGKVLGGDDFVETKFTPGYRSLQPFKPAHLKGVFSQIDGVSVQWIRRDRLSSDDWATEDIPMSEQIEQYELELTSGSGVILQKSVNQSNAIVTLAELENVFGQLPPTLEIFVAQTSATVGPGPKNSIQLTLN